MYGFDIHGVHTRQSLLKESQNSNDAIDGLSGDRSKGRCLPVACESVLCSYSDQYTLQAADGSKGHLERFLQRNLYFFNFHTSNLHDYPPYIMAIS